MFGFIKKVFVVTMTFFGNNVLKINPWKCVLMNNEKCKIRPHILNINSNNLHFILALLKLSFPDVFKNINVNVCNLVSITIETIHIKRHEAYKCKWRPDASVYNNKQRWNNDKFIYECKELINKGMCDKNFISNVSDWEHECDKSCDIDEYLDYKNCKCRKKLVDNLVEEFSKNIDENEIIYNGTFSDYENVCNSWPIFIVFITITNDRSNIGVINFNPHTETVIYWTYELKMLKK